MQGSNGFFASQPLLTTKDINHKATKRNISHYASIPNEPISFLTPYSGLILTIWIIILFLIKHYILERLCFPKVYKKFLDMDEPNRRGFTNYHVAGGTKVVILIAAIKPFIDVVFGKSDLSSPYSSLHGYPKNGDVLLVVVQLLVAAYIFELFYRRRVTPIAVLHHGGGIIIAQAAVALSLNLRQEPNATAEFVLCLVWGFFDVIVEGWPNLALILYRVYPDSHRYLAHWFLATYVVILLSAIAETILVMILFAQAWKIWQLSFKIAIPILHVLFTITQLDGCRIFWAMYQKQRELLRSSECV
jgi:hypothetical protein